jgi:hypothetical protein
LTRKSGIVADRISQLAHAAATAADASPQRQTEVVKNGYSRLLCASKGLFHDDAVTAVRASPSGR